MSTLNGTILKIELKDFMTYNNTTIFPDKGINLIVGPNGTGKSTIACAIFLCLAGNLSNFGRSKSYNDYIRYGQNKAIVCIDLFFDGENDNRLPIKLIINKTRQKSAIWYVKEIQKNYNEVRKIVESFGIFVNNITQFLPQERVGIFTKLTSNEILFATIEASGNHDSLNNLNSLKKLGNKMLELHDQKSKLNNLMIDLESRSKKMNSENEIFNERISHIDSYNKLSAWLSFISYNQILEKNLELIQKLDLMKAQLKEKNDFLNEVTQKHKEITILNLNIRSKIQKKEAKRKKSLELLNNNRESFHKLYSDYKKKKAELIELVALKKKRSERITFLKEKYNELTSNMKHLDENELILNVNKLKEEEKKLNTRNFEQKNQLKTLSNQLSEINNLNDDHEIQIQKIKKDLNSSNFKTRIEKILNESLKSQILVQERWLTENLKLLSGKAYGPIFKEITLVKKEYSSLIESYLGIQSLCTFVFEKSEDSLKFQDAISSLGHKNYSSYVVKNQIDNDPNQILKRNNIIEEARGLGFNQFLIDFFDAPEIIIRALIVGNLIDQIPVSLNDKIDEKYIIESKYITRYINNGRLCTIKRDKMGKILFIHQRSIRGGLILEEGNSKDLIKQKEKKLEKSYKLMEENNCKIIEILQKIKKLKENSDSFLEELDSARTKYSSALLALSNFHSLKQELESIIIEIKETKNLQNSKHKIEKLEKELSLLISPISKLFESLHNSYLELSYRIGSSFKYYSLVAKSIKEEEEIEKEIEFLKGEISIIDQEVHCQQETTENNQKLIKKKQEEIENQKFKIDELIKYKYSNDINEIIKIRAKHEEFIKIYENSLETSSEDIKTISRKIDDLKKKVDEINNQEENVNLEIEKIEKGLETQILDLVHDLNNNFNNFFANIGCAGFINFIKEGSRYEFCKWGISIDVKFHSTEKILPLDASRCSGGERAVTTILYLLSLPEKITKVPFRLVDEINQGMDPDNEKSMHNLLFSSSKFQEETQYFVITPKLLKDLKYGERSSVHIIMYGSLNYLV